MNEGMAESGSGRCWVEKARTEGSNSSLGKHFYRSLAESNCKSLYLTVDVAVRSPAWSLVGRDAKIVHYGSKKMNGKALRMEVDHYLVLIPIPIVYFFSKKS
jgi:hypothetical protein